MINYRRTTKNALAPERRENHERQEPHRLQHHVPKHCSTAHSHLLHSEGHRDSDELRQRKTRPSSSGYTTIEWVNLTVRKYEQKEGTMNTFNENHSSSIEEKSERGYIVTIGRERIRVVSVYIGTKSASKAICDTAVKKILYDTKDNL